MTLLSVLLLRENNHQLFVNYVINKGIDFKFTTYFPENCLTSRNPFWLVDFGCHRPKKLI